MDVTLFWLNILLPVLSIAIPVFATVYTVNNRIKNENRENHKPYLLLSKVTPLQELDIYSYYFTLNGRNYRFMTNSTEPKGERLFLELTLENVGYGVASNIRFYDLLTGEIVAIDQASTVDRDQKLFTTLDIAHGHEKSIQTEIHHSVVEQEGIETGDHNRILCVYQDLNHNIHDFILCINTKVGGHYDFFAYQPSSKSYKRWVRENKREYRRIYREYQS